MFVPSVYQQQIFDFIENDFGNGFIRAAAGSGKTTTIIQALNYVPPYLNTLFLAFNKSIADSLAERIPRHTTAMTVHKLGLMQVQNAFSNAVIDQYKYSNITEKLVRKVYEHRFKVSKYYLRNLILDYVHFAQVTLTDPRDESKIEELAVRYGLSTRFRTRMSAWVTEVLQRGYELAVVDGSISFNDMLWLPSVIPMPCPQYDLVLVDEAQDLSRAQREIVLRAVKPTGRVIFCADPAQAIYGFSGADTDSVEALRQLPMMTELPLSICYRCPISHLSLAQQLVPDIEPAPNAPEGTISDILVQDVPQLIRPHDLVLSRTNAPLYQLYLDLMTAGIPAQIQGKDVLREFSALLGFTEPFMLKHKATLAEACKAYVEARASELQAYEGAEFQLEMIRDQAEVVIALAARKGLTSAAQASALLKEMSADKQGAVLLSSIHRAKGLEAERVFLLFPDMLPHPKATQDWAKTQEFNLKYVALTRAKQDLFFVHREQQT